MLDPSTSFKINIYNTIKKKIFIRNFLSSTQTIIFFSYTLYFFDKTNHYIYDLLLLI